MLNDFSESSLIPLESYTGQGGFGFFSKYDIFTGSKDVLYTFERNELVLFHLINPLEQLLTIFYFENEYRESIKREFYENLLINVNRLGEQEFRLLCNQLLQTKDNYEEQFSLEFFDYLSSKFSNKEIEVLNLENENFNKIDLCCLNFDDFFKRLFQYNKEKKETDVFSMNKGIRYQPSTKFIQTYENKTPIHILQNTLLDELDYLASETPLIISQEGKNIVFKPNYLIKRSLTRILLITEQLVEQLAFLTNLLLKDNGLINEKIKFEKKMKYVLDKQILQRMPISNNSIIDKKTALNIRRFNYFLKFVEILWAMLDIIDDEFKGQFTQKPLQAFVFDQENDIFVKYVLIKYSSWERVIKNQIYDYYIKTEEKEALRVLNSVEKDTAMANQFSSDELNCIVSKLEFTYLIYFLSSFWKKGKFLDFIKIIVQRIENNLNELKTKKNLKQIVENQRILVFLMQFFVSLINTFKEQRQLKSFFSFNFSYIKNKIFNRKTKPAFVLEDEVHKLKKEELIVMIKEFTKLILKSSYVDLRLAVINTVSTSDEYRIFDFFKSFTRVEDIQAVLGSENLLEGTLTVKNADFLIQLALFHKNYSLALNIILEISKRNLRLLESEELKGNGLLELIDKPIEVLKRIQRKLKEEGLIGLDLLESYSDKAERFLKNTNFDDPNNRHLFGEFKKMKLNIQINRIINNELKLSLDDLRAIRDLKNTETNDDVINRLIAYKKTIIACINLCPDFGEFQTKKRILKPNKLKLSILTIDRLMEADFDSVIGNMVTYLKTKGRINSLATLSGIDVFLDISSFPNLKTTMGQLMLFKPVEEQIKKNLTLLAYDKNLLYPLNISREIEEWITLIVNSGSSEAMRQLLLTVEQANRENKLFRDLEYNLDDINSEKYYQFSIWHLHVIFREELIPVIKIYDVLKVYTKMIVESRNKEGKLSHLKFRLLDSFLVILAYLFNKIEDIVESERYSDKRTEIVTQFLKSSDPLINFLKESQKELIGSKTSDFSIYFRLTERITKTVLLMKKMWDNSKMDFYHNKIQE